jgi:RNA polymerase sigma-70 factor (ECF subfamily)
MHAVLVTEPTGPQDSSNGSVLAPMPADVAAAAGGDRRAFERLYRLHVDRVYSLCTRMLGDRVVAEEVTQDVFVRVWEKLPQFRAESAFGTWLHRVAVNVVLEHLRSTKRDAARLIDSDDVGNQPRAADVPADTTMDLDAALARLPAGARAVFVLHLEGYSHDEIAELTGIAAGTARAQLWRARRALAKSLDQ